MEEFERIRKEVKESIHASKTLKFKWSANFKKQQKKMNDIQKDWEKTVEWQRAANDRKWELARKENKESLDLREQEYKRIRKYSLLSVYFSWNIFCHYCDVSEPCVFV